MNKSNPYSVLFLLLLSTSSIYSQFVLSGELRPRSEYRHGYGVMAEADQDAVFITNQRARLNLDYKSDLYEFRFTLQDIRIWGDTRTTSQEGGARTLMHEAWAKIYFKENWAVKFGRQEIYYGEKRLLSNSGWAQQSRRHDAAIVMYQKDGLNLHAGFAYNQSTDNLKSNYYTVNNYKTMHLLVAQKSINTIDANFILLNLGNQGNANSAFKTIYNTTVGVVAKHTTDEVLARTSLFGQYGTMQDGDTPINAMLFSIDGTFKVAKNHSLGVGFEHLSGNDQASDGVNSAFTPYFASNHMYHGNMDYFYAGGRYNNSTGLNDLFVLHQYNKDKFTLTSTLHSFSTDGQLLLTSDRSLGTEIDIAITYDYSSDISFTGGYSRFFGTDGMEQILGGDKSEVNHWAWLSILIKPTFFRSSIEE